MAGSGAEVVPFASQLLLGQRDLGTFQRDSKVGNPFSTPEREGPRERERGERQREQKMTREKEEGRGRQREGEHGKMVEEISTKGAKMGEGGRKRGGGVRE